MESGKRTRGRPPGSVKPAYERRQRRDYRFSPTTLRLLEEGQRLLPVTETALVEAAIQHYLTFLTTQEVAHAQQEKEYSPIQYGVSKPTVAQHEAQREQQPTSSKPPALPPAPTSSATSSSRLPTYQIFVKHEPGTCPPLPEAFAYLDLPRSIQPEQCPIHRVFARPCSITVARQRVEQLKQEVAGITHIWLDKGGVGLPKDSWQKKHGQWVSND
jgi:hypothetical protein